MADNHTRRGPGGPGVGSRGSFRKPKDLRGTLGKLMGYLGRYKALLVIVVLVAAAGAGIVRIYGSRLPELRSKSQALEAQIQQTEKQNDALRSDLEHQGDQDFIQGLARDDLGLASDGERIFYDVNN